MLAASILQTLSIESEPNMLMKLFDTIKSLAPFLFDGIKVTSSAAVISIILGIIIGLIACIVKVSKIPVLSQLAGVYIWVIRGTPMIVQALFVYFGAPQIIRIFIDGFRMSPFVAGIITLSLNAGAYLAEIFRSGIQAVDVGQIEASRSLGISSSKTMLKIILPQAFKITIPSLVNQFIITVKDTSILTVIGLREIVNKAGQYVSIRYNYFETYIWVAIFYLAIISALMVLSKFVEKKMNYGRQG